MSQYQLGVIGAGVMAEAIITGVIKAGLYKSDEIIASGRGQQRLNLLQERLGIATAAHNDEVISKAKMVILAIKPQQLHAVKSKMQVSLTGNQMLISIMAGVGLASLKDLFGQVPIFRVMPNTPAQIGYGMSAISHNDLAKPEGLETVLGIFQSIGETIVLPEEQMDAVGALSGSGPAYMYQFIEAMADGGVMLGLPREVAYRLAAQTMVGAGQMVLETGLHPGALKDQVTSPGGTTIRALKVLEVQGLRGIVIEAVEQAYLQSKKLGEIK